MKKGAISLTLVVCFAFLPVLRAQENWSKALTFVVTADMRYFTKGPYLNSRHFLGLVQAVKTIGPGSFMVSPGDCDPPDDVRDVISMVLGQDYPWYPVMGNHELESTTRITNMEWLRNLNKAGTSLPRIVRKGPANAEETTYSFDWANCHFVSLNLFYDGKSDSITKYNVVPELLSWLESDLAANNKKHIFVFGHMPMLSIPDMDNGRLRNVGDCLDRYPQNDLKFQQLLSKYKVSAYFCGHTHDTSFANINGVWQLDAGHARGIEEAAPEEWFEICSKLVEDGTRKGISTEEAFSEYFKASRGNADAVRRAIFLMNLGEGATSEKSIADPVSIRGFGNFYVQYKQGGASRDALLKAYWENISFARSTFIKVSAGKEKVKVEYYRDDGRGGPYSLRHTLILDR